MHPSVVAFIPARGGSTGIRRKNVQLLGDKPLIAYSIEAALKAELIDRVIVNTEDDEVADIAKSFGAEVPFRRPRHLATDTASLGDVLAFAMNWLEENEGAVPEYFVQLLPTSPFRPAGLADRLVEKVLYGPYHGAITVKPITKNLTCDPYFTLSNQGTLVPVEIPLEPHTACQLLYRPFMLVGVYSKKMPGPPEYIEIIRNPICHIDIDTPEDLRLSNAIMKEGLFDFDEPIQ